jgi:hypothetical protein
VAATEHRRRSDRARLVRDPLDGRHREAARVALAMDRLSTHSLAGLHEALPPEEARRLAERAELHHAPRHGPWLDMAEIGFGALGRQCLARRVARHDAPRRHAAPRNGTTSATPRRPGSYGLRVIGSLGRRLPARDERA